MSTALRTSIRNGSAFGLAAVLVGAGLVVAPQTATAAPETYTTPGIHTTTVPAGACFVTATVLGGGGGNYMLGGGGLTRGGSGASVTATFPVVPGDVSVRVASGGDRGLGYGGGAAGQANNHHGAQGGGYSELVIDGSTLILAGGGGGTGGGHATASFPNYPFQSGDGQGGDAGLPHGVGEFPGTDGGNGIDSMLENQTVYVYPKFPGGGGGGTGPGGGPGAGGTAAKGTAVPALDGSPGDGRDGGAGADDRNEDAGGGGGSGWQGGGGGAATANTSLAGSGGGGGSSYVAAGATNVTSSHGSAQTNAPTGETGAFPGADGSVSLEWDTQSCATARDDEKLYQPHGPVSVDVLGNDEGTPSGGPRLLNGTTPVTSLTVAGEGVWTISGTNVVFTPAPGFRDNPTPVDYQWSTAGGTVVSAAVTVGYRVVANDDDDLNNIMGSTVTLPVLGNDVGSLQASSVRIFNGSDLLLEHPVTGEGTWLVNSTTGAITFTPEADFTGDPTPVEYRVTDDFTTVTPADPGAWDTATVTVTYLPVPQPDVISGIRAGNPVTLLPTDNDHDALDPASTRLLDPAGDPVAELVVPGEGTWTVDPVTGVVTFVPDPALVGNPTPVEYQVVKTGASAPQTTTITIAYLPEAFDDEKLLQPLGAPVAVDTIGNDIGDLDLMTFRIVGSPGPGSDLVVPGEGTWSVAPATGQVTFTPEPDFTGDPSPIDYTVDDEWGQSTGSTVTVSYRLEALDDVSAGNEPDDPVTVLVTDNDHQGLVPVTVRLITPAGDPVVTLPVPGEGVWTVGPSTGEVTFTPEPGFVGNPTPVRYQVEDLTGVPVEATVKVAYTPQAAPDEDLLNPPGEAVTLDPLVNDTDRDDLDPASVRVWNGTSWVTTYTVPGEGTWEVDPATGEVTFEPLSTLNTDPSPVGYQVADVWGETAESAITVTYRPDARDDVSTGHPQGGPATVDVSDNDYDTLDPTTVKLITPGGLGTTLTVPGEGVWTVDPATGEVTFEPEPGFVTNPTPVRYQIETPTGEISTATVTVAYLPVANPDESLGNLFGQPVRVTGLLGNDTDPDDLDPATLRLLDADGDPVIELTVTGEGTWRVDPATGTATFTPLMTFTGDPTPAPYRITDVFGQNAESTITVTYLPDARDDEDLDNVLGTTVVIDAIGNDHDALLPSTMRLLDASGDPVTALVVPGEGEWSVNAAGQVTFVPEPGFLVDPSPVGYQVGDVAGTVVTATVTVSYLPTVVADSTLGNPAGAPVTVPVLDNDTGEFIVNSVRLVNPAGDPVTMLVVPGEGTWRVNGRTGAVTFTPLATFPGNPAPVSYRVTDVTGDTVETTVTITYRVSVVDVVKGGNETGDPVTVTVSIHPEIDPGTLRIIDPTTGDPVTTVTVPGEGTWIVGPGAGELTFTPEPGFTGDPTQIEYQLEDPATGDPLTATVTVLYGPLAHEDDSPGNPFGEAVEVPVLDNDEGVLDPGTVRILTPGTGDPVTTLVVSGEGVWTVDLSTGVITFTPEPGFTGDPTPIGYFVADTDGKEAASTVTVTYQPEARDDISTGNEAGTAVSVDVTGNDHDKVDPTTVRLIDPSGNPVASLVVPGEGTWTVNTSTGVVTFTPEAGFTGDPTAVTYTALDADGFPVTATITIGYLQGSLAFTGAEPMNGLLVGVLLLLLGAGIMIGMRRRRGAPAAV